jgi:hypothetical protein
MEEFGFFSHIYEKLPPDFTAIFEIARVLEDETSELSRTLREVMKLPTPAAVGRKDAVQDFHRYTPAGDRYAADLITSYHDVARVYPNQFLLPEEIFLQRLALRELWMPVAKSGVILPVNDTDQDFAFDSRKQKVYVLFDTSSSMQSHHRIHLAKAILYYFLHQNKSDLGHISLRTFDDTIGDLHTAVDAESYDALMRYVLRIAHLGEGTLLQKAIIQALDDIQGMEHLSGAEILIITDGAVSIDEDSIRSKMDEQIVINTIKIGHAQAFATDEQLHDLIVRGKIKDKVLIDLEEREHDIQQSLRATQAHGRQQALDHALHGVRSQMAARRQELGRDLLAYGHELDRLSAVFVTIDDFNETDRFRADPETISDLEELAKRLEEEASEFLTPEITKKLAVLHDHIQFLQKYETDESLKARLRAIDDHLRKLLAEYLGAPSDAAGSQGNAEGAVQAMTSTQLPMSDEDIRDLHFLLEADMSLGRGWALLMRWLWERAKMVGRKMRGKKI